MFLLQNLVAIDENVTEFAAGNAPVGCEEEKGVFTIFEKIGSGDKSFVGVLRLLLAWMLLSHLR